MYHRRHSGISSFALKDYSEYEYEVNMTSVSAMACSNISVFEPVLNGRDCSCSHSYLSRIDNCLDTLVPYSQSNSSEGVATDHSQSRSRTMADCPSYY